MRILRTLVIIILVLIILFLFIALFLSSTVHVDESITINSSAGNTMLQITNLKNWPKWSPYQQADPKMRVLFEGATEGMGSKLAWESNDIGNGSILIREIIPEKSIGGELNFDGNRKSFTSWELETTPEGTKLTWNIDVIDLSYPFGRWAGLFISDKIHDRIQTGLTNIKAIAESSNTPVQNNFSKTSPVNESETPSMIVLSIKDSCKMEDFSNKFRELYAEINSYMKAIKATQTAPPFAIFHSWNPNGVSIIEACIRINKYVQPYDRILFTEFPQYKIVSVNHMGPYNTIGAAYDAIEKYTKTYNKSIAAPPREVYLTDPSLEPDSSKWETQVYYPIK